MLKHHPTTRPAFTLIETITALSILLVMLGLVNFIFRDAQRAVNLGLETGEVIGAQRGITSQFQRDFEQMIGPHQGRIPDNARSGGFLIITQKYISDDAGPPNTPATNAAANNGRIDVGDGEGLEVQLPTNNSGQNSGRNTERRLVRSDQIAFVRTRGTDQPTGPALDNTFTSRIFPESTGRTSSAIRMWYGHGLRTNDDGSDQTQGRLNRLGAAGSPNENPLEWILARQALFLDDTVQGSAIETAPSTRTPAGVYADSPNPLAGVSGYSAAGLANLNVGAVNVLHGLTDYSYFAFEDGDGDMMATTDRHPVGALVEGGGNPTETLRRVGGLPGDVDLDQYHRRAIRNNVYFRNNDRLRVNPTPPFNTTSVGGNYQAWQIAQTLPILAEGVSDFVVEFAADMYGGGAGGVNEATPAPSPYAPDGQVDLDQDGRIAWYAFGNISNPPAPAPATGTLDPLKGPRTFPPATDYRPTSAAGFLPTTAVTGAFVWRHDTFDPGEYDIGTGTWSPQFSGSFSDATPPIAGVPALNDEDSRFCDWPYLIRIRYRLHDARGQLASGQQVFIDLNGNDDLDDGEPVDSRNGIWFEQILPVNRPVARRIP